MKFNPPFSERSSRIPRPAFAHVRAACPEDLPGIARVESQCFPVERRSSRRAMRQSLRSPTQSVWVLGRGSDVFGAMVLFHHPKSLRIYSIAVAPECRGTGGGRRLVRMALALARRSGRQTVTLEADANDTRLVNWYASLGFCVYGPPLTGYYPDGDAVRMRAKVKWDPPAAEKKKAMDDERK
ncbi:MAG: GNAT family N-acetyltransferase [Verrucomicrobia bacterium]|nr:GNAT family N-acetyltransferase [Verrucomicrobiota bacterium]MCH8512571.1 GNAT family N-acetyltransferase [Kiritimatiellia bacterium]